MWKSFRYHYRNTKSSSSASALDSLITLLDAYPKEGSLAKCKEIRAEIKRVCGITRWFSMNPAKKYATAIEALKNELDREELRIRVGDTREAEGHNRQMNHTHRRKAYEAMLKSRQTDAEYCAPITSAFKEVCKEEKFTKYLLEEIGWTNATSWLNWALRAVTPSMAAGWAAHDATALMRAMALKASVSGHKYLERYFLELSIYCAAAAEKADIGVIFEQASIVFGPLLGPAIGAPTQGIWSYAYSGGKKLGQIGITAGTTALLVDGTHEPTITTRESGKDVTQTVNLMRFTHAWLKYAIHEKPSKSMEVVMREFGGRRGCTQLLDALDEL